MHATNFKPSPTLRKLQRKDARRKLVRSENENKAEVRRRDRGCRFPLCGCRALGLQLKARPEVSHSKHKGMGGNPAGDRSKPELLVQLCLHRHQHGVISMHAGTLKPRYLSREKFDGPIAWLVDVAAIYSWAGGQGNVVGPRWKEIARESAVQQWEPFTPEQQEMLDILAEMKL